MEKIKHIYRPYLSHKEFLKSLLFSILILAAALFINFYASIYALEKASNPVTDIVLDNIRVFDVDGIFLYGPIFFYSFIAYILAARPNKIPFTLKSISLFILVRSIFISLTHIGPAPTRINIPAENIINIFTSQGDLFFSGHTGLPFLLALIFWEDVRLRILFILSSLFFGVVVLMGHLHYSIDVLSAFFITYTIYHIAKNAFQRDKEIFLSGI